MNDCERLCRYVARYFYRHKMERWPTVRDAARALRMKQEDVESAASDWHEASPMLTGYGVGENPLGDLWVELLHPEELRSAPKNCGARNVANA